MNEWYKVRMSKVRKKKYVRKTMQANFHEGLFTYDASQTWVSSDALPFCQKLSEND